MMRKVGVVLFVSALIVPAAVSAEGVEYAAPEVDPSGPVEWLVEMFNSAVCVVLDVAEEAPSPAGPIASLDAANRTVTFSNLGVPPEEGGILERSAKVSIWAGGSDDTCGDTLCVSFTPLAAWSGIAVPDPEARPLMFEVPGMGVPEPDGFIGRISSGVWTVTVNVNHYGGESCGYTDSWLAWLTNIT